MCDGVTQGQPGMELSLFSRDVIALASGVALSHNTYDAAIYLGVCDKIVPGLIIAAATFGHIPAIFLPAGPMTSGLPNDEKGKVRQRFAKGEIGRDELMAAEIASYHGPGTCTFYGTANTNQMLMEFMGLHLPGASFVNPNTPLRDALTVAGAKRALLLPVGGAFHSPLMEPAREELEKAILDTTIHKPSCPIYQNVTAAATQDTASIKENLIAQLTGPVKWTQTIQQMRADGATLFTEYGPGKVLQGLVKKIDREAQVTSALMV